MAEVLHDEHSTSNVVVRHRLKCITFNFNCLFVVETQGFLNVTGNHVHCKCCSRTMLETVQDRVVVTMDH